MEFKLVPRKLITDIDEYECSDKWMNDENNHYVERTFLPNLTFYRFHDSYYMGERITCYKFKAIRETPCGYWIMDDRRERWISKNSMRRFCYPTKEEAWTNFVARKERQLKLLKARISDVEHTINIIKQIEKKQKGMEQFEKEDAEKCPDCNKLSVTGDWSGISCKNPKCNYHFCY